jgi:hypothetical protein
MYRGSFPVALVLTTTLWAPNLWAMDFWQSKPFLEWSDKEVQRMLTNSPWAKPVSATGAEAMTGATRGSATTSSDTTSATDAVGPMTAQGTIPSTVSKSRDQSANSASLQVVVRWQSALPVREARERLRLGTAARPLPDREEPDYVIALSGLPHGLVNAALERDRRDLLRETSLHVKGKPASHPSDLETGLRSDAGELILVFPKNAPFTLDDKDVEFSTHIGPWSIKCKFHLKDLVYQGKLEL